MINIVALTRFIHNAAVLSANGGSAVESGAAGGSGGSIFIQTQYFTGNGPTRAVGGQGNSYDVYSGGGGSGGRIAVYYETSDYSGSISAVGGIMAWGMANSGGPGTIYIKDLSKGENQLIIDNGNNAISTTVVNSPAATRGSVAWLMQPEANISFTVLKIKGSGCLAIDPQANISFFFKFFTFIVSRIFFDNLT